MDLENIFGGWLRLSITIGIANRSCNELFCAPSSYRRYAKLLTLIGVWSVIVSSITVRILFTDSRCGVNRSISVRISKCGDMRIVMGATYFVQGGGGTRNAPFARSVNQVINGMRCSLAL